MIKGKKIALFMLPLLTYGGGAEKYFINLACELRDQGILADVITLDANSFKKFAFILHLITLRFKTIIKYNVNFFKNFNVSGRESAESVTKSLGKARWIKVNFKNIQSILQQYDLIYSKNEIIYLLLLKHIGYKKLPPIIIGVHTPLHYQNAKNLFSKLHNLLYMGFFYRWLITGIKYIHLSNRFTKNLVDKKFNIKSFLIYYPFSINDIIKQSQEIASPINFNKKIFNLIFVGRISEQKGIDLLINLIDKLNKKNELIKKINLSIFGTGDKITENKLTFLSQKCSWVKYYGHIENKFIPSILLQQNLLLSPSKWETLPYNILEAQALGLPVIAFDIPGPNDIIINTVTGFLVKNEDEFFIKLAETIEKNIAFRKTSIISNINNKFSSQLINRQLINMFNSVISL